MSVTRHTKLCVKCQIELRCKTNGILLVEMATYGPVTARDADLWHCPECGFEVVVGLADNHRFAHWSCDMDAAILAQERLGQRVILVWLNARERDLFKSGRKAAEEKAKVGL
jgi:hypothetical protein